MILANALRGFLLFGTLLLVAHVLLRRSIALDPHAQQAQQAQQAYAQAPPPGWYEPPVAPSPFPPFEAPPASEDADFERALNGPDVDTFFAAKGGGTAAEGPRGETAPVPWWGEDRGVGGVGAMDAFGGEGTGFAPLF